MEKLKLENIADMHQLILLVQAEFADAVLDPVSLAVLKADVDSAFRRVRLDASPFFQSTGSLPP